MDDFITRQNIRRYETQLKGECESEQRAVIEALLDGERRRLQETRSGKRPNA